MTRVVRSLESPDMPFNFQYPAGATIVTGRAGGRDNAMAVAWHTAISRAPALYDVSISRKRFTHGLISESGEFVVNFMPYDQSELVGKVAGCSGRDVDKFDVFHVATSPGTQVEALVLTDAFASYECRVIGRHQYGDMGLFIGQVLAVHYDPAHFHDDGRLDLGQVQPVVYMGRDWYTSTGEGSIHLDRDKLVPAAPER